MSVQSGLGLDVQGTGDFNGDGKADILWKTPAASRRLGDERLNVLSGSNCRVNPDRRGQVHGTGDLNGDGKADIAWQNTDGTGRCG